MNPPDPFPMIKTPWDSATPPTGPDCAGEGSPVPVPDHILIRRIGRGSYGEVWLARSVLGVYRAVKIIRRRAFDDDRPFEREFAGIQRFEPVSRRHESQLNILHVGRGSDYFYYVMELGDAVGEGDGRSQMGDGGTGPFQNAASILLSPKEYTPRTLRSELLFRGRLPVDECIRLGLALSTALEHLHRHGLVHRDIKPSNIVFVNGIPKLADIGLVALAEATASFVGTEGYLPPEGPGTAQADLFSLGKVLYEMSTGHDRQQFPELPTNVAELPDRAALAEFNEVLLRACAPDVRQRYQSAAELHSDLALLQSGKSVARMRAVEQRLKLVFRAGAALAVIAVIAGLAFLYQQAQTREARRLAAENRALADDKTRLAGENHLRLARLDIANGVRLLDDGDPAGALLWYAEALPLLTGSDEESVHRIRIRQTLRGIPGLLHVFPHEYEGLISTFSPDGSRIATGTDWGFLRVWDARSGATLWQPGELGAYTIERLQFTRDSRFLFASSLPRYGFFKEARPTNVVALFQADTGRRVYSLAAANLDRAELSPDDRWLVTADAAHLIQVRDARDGKVISELKGHTDRIVEFQISAAGGVLASTSLDRTLRFWQLPDGRPLTPPIPFDVEQGPFALSGDGGLFATAEVKSGETTNSVIRVWNTATGAPGGNPVEIPGVIESLWFPSGSPQDLFVLTSRQAVLLDAKTREPLARLIQPHAGVTLYSVSADGRRFALGSREGLAGVWNLETGEQLLPPCLRGRQLTDINFSPDSSQLLVQTGTGVAMLLPVSHRPAEDAVARLDGAISAASPKAFLEWQRFTPDRRYFLLILANGAVRCVDFARMTADRMPENTIEGVFSPQVTFDKTGRRGAIYCPGGRTNVVKMWSEANGVTNRFTLPLPARLNEQFRFTSDGTRLLLPCAGGKLLIWKTADGTLERSVEINSADGKCAPFPDGRKAFILLPQGTFGLQDLDEGAQTSTPLPRFNLTGFRFDPAGERWASAGMVPWSRIWSARTCEPLTPPLNHGGEVQYIDWSPDGRRVITAGLTPELKVWDAATGEQVLSPLRLGDKPLVTGQWSLDGRLIVARSDENTVRVWDSASGEPVTPVLEHSSYVRLAHLVANNRLITLSLPNVMRAWDLVETRLPADVIGDYARLVSGRRINSAGVVVPLRPEELAELSHSLHTRAPELFR
jgi:WD40 repeat protein